MNIRQSAGIFNAIYLFFLLFCITPLLPCQLSSPNNLSNWKLSALNTCPFEQYQMVSVCVCV